MQHLYRQTTAASQHLCVFYLFSLKPSLLYLHGWNLEVGLPVEAVGHLEWSGAVHLSHTFHSDHIQLELGDQIKTYKV